MKTKEGGEVGLVMKWEKGEASQFYLAKNMKEINFMVGEEIYKRIEDGKEGETEGDQPGKRGTHGKE